MRPKIVYKKENAKGDELLDNPLIISAVVGSASDEMVASSLRKAAYNFFASGEYLKSVIYCDGQPLGAKVVASYFSEKSDEFSPFPPSSWIVSFAISDPVVKQALLKGDIDHFSFDQAGSNQAPLSRIDVSRIEKSYNDAVIDMKGDYPMTFQQEIIALREKCEALIQKPICKDAGLEAQLAELHSKIQGLGASETATSLEKGEGGKQVMKGFWHGGLMVHQKATSEKTKSVVGPAAKVKSEGCGPIWS